MSVNLSDIDILNIKDSDYSRIKSLFSDNEAIGLIQNGHLIDYPSFKKYYKLIATDSNKQQKLDADTKVTQQVNFTRNLDRAGG